MDIKNMAEKEDECMMSVADVERLIGGLVISKIADLERENAELRGKLERAMDLALPVSVEEWRAAGQPDEVPFAECRNPDCPIGCPDSHCLDFGAGNDEERKAGEEKG